MPQKIVRLPTQIYVFLVFNLFRWLSFWGPIFTLFYADIGLSYTQILSLIAIKNITSLILEIPSGVFADRVGRKWSIFFSSIMQTIGFVILYFTTDFYFAAIANILLGGFVAFASGADEAWTYDTLKANSKTDDYKLVQIIVTGSKGVAFVVSAIIGGYLASQFGYQYVVGMSAVAFAISSVVALFLTEPKLETFELLKNDIISHTKTSFLILWSSLPLMIIVLLGAVFATTDEVVNSLYQGLFKSIGASDTDIGMIAAAKFATSMMVAGVFVIFVTKHKRRVAELSMIIFAVVVQVAAIFWFSNYYILVVAIASGQAFYALGRIFVQNYLNEHVESKNRATCLSIQSFANNLVIGVSVPFIGWVADIWNIQTGFLVLLIVIILLSTVSLFVFARYEKN